MAHFFKRHPEVAEEEFRTATIYDDPELPNGEYGFFEMYCDEPGCDCRRVFIQANREIVVSDREHFEAGDALFLDRLCRKSNESTWRLDPGKILEAVGQGFDVDEVEHFLAAKSDDSIPDTIAHLLGDLKRRAGQIFHAGTAEVFQVKGEAIALLILHDSTAKSLCYAAGKNRLIVPAAKVAAFRRALRKLGYPVAPGRGGE